VEPALGQKRREPDPDEVALSVRIPIGDWFQFFAGGGDEASNAIAACVAATGVLALLCVYVPIGVRLMRARSVALSIETLYESHTPSATEERASALDDYFAGSPLARTWTDLLARRRDVGADSPGDRAPVRLADLLVEQPLVPFGVRRSLARSLPRLLMILGLVGTLAVLVIAFGAPTQAAPPERIVGFALRSVLWALVLGGAAHASGLILRGADEAMSARLDGLVASTYRCLTSGEIAMRGAHAQELGFERVSSLLLQVATDLGETIDRGLLRIERSTASAASLVSDKQRSALETLVTDLSTAMNGGVEAQVTSLQTSLERTNDTQGALAELIQEQITSGAETNVRIAGTLARAADAIDEASGSMTGGATELKPLIDHMSEVALALERTALRLDEIAAGDPGAPYEALRSEVARMGGRFVELTEPLRDALERLDGSAGAIATSVTDFVARAGALEARLSHAAENPASEPALRNAPSAASSRLGTASSSAGDLSAALERSQLNLAPLHPDTSATGRAGIDEPADQGSGERLGNSALLNRYKAPRFSIEELPDALRSFTADDTLERARGRDDSSTALDAVALSAEPLAEASGSEASVSAPSLSESSPSGQSLSAQSLSAQSDTAAAAPDDSVDDGGESQALANLTAPPEADEVAEPTAEDAGPPKQPAREVATSESDEQRRSRRLERFFGRS
jgi:hypothetical protein